MSAKKTALVFDIDSTITPPRQPIQPEMVAILERLAAPFHLAAGSHFELLEHQLFQPLERYGFRGAFDAFVSNGAVHYRCAYHGGGARPDLTLVHAFRLREALGDADYAFLLDRLEQARGLAEFALPPELTIASEGHLVDRTSMVNFSPMGRAKIEDARAQSVRAAFVAHDRATGYRDRLLRYLRAELEPLAERHRLTVTLGGQTSFDIVVAGQDKSVAVRHLLDAGADEVLFFGDALFEGGNDGAILGFVRGWSGPPPCPVTAIRVEGWQDTVRHLRALGLVRG